jgi:hypothetical protein
MNYCNPEGVQLSVDQIMYVVGLCLSSLVLLFRRPTSENQLRAEAGYFITHSLHVPLHVHPDGVADLLDSGQFVGNLFWKR